MLRVGGACVVVAVLNVDAAAQAWPNMPAPPHPIADPWDEPEAPPPRADAPPPRTEPAPPPVVTPPVPASLKMRKRRIVRRKRDFIDPSVIANTRPPRPSYPRAAVERPLLLPAGSSEGTVGLGVGRDSQHGLALSYGVLALRGRAAGESFEVFFGLDLVPIHGQPAQDQMVEVEPLQRVSGGIKARFATDTALVFDAHLSSAGEGYQRMTPGVQVQHKVRAKRAALVAAGGFAVGLQWYRNDPVDKAIAGFGALAGQVQASPMLALQLDGAFAHHVLIGGDFDGETYRSYQFGFSMIASLGHHLDMVPFVSFAVTPARDAMLAGLAFNVH